ncbi:cytochrome c oxidase subunit 3 family protein [Balneolaceae bacterium ANBcel3]|nr:cytochrome c oxidase subunit 3 family protein [Balneolaceae bacterium ANBcel3]
MSTSNHHTDDHLQHHFKDEDQQFESSKLGMWIFLVTEMLMFGGLFVAYIIYRAWHPDLFYLAAQELDAGLGALNTVVLIASSLTIALAIRSLQLDEFKKSIQYLSATLVLAATFLVIKYIEYTDKFAKGILPGGHYSYEGISHEMAANFFSIYYLMTGLHGIHVLLGMGLIGWMIIKVRKRSVHSRYFTPVENTGLFWHLVDIIWIFLFPLLYLID